MQLDPIGCGLLAGGWKLVVPVGLGCDDQARYTTRPPAKQALFSVSVSGRSDFLIDSNANCLGLPW